MTVAGTARLLQIITIAMIVGVVVFGCVVVFAFGALRQPPQGSMLSLGGIGFAVVAFVMHILVPAFIVKQTIPRTGGETAALCGLFLSKTIVATALLEGAAFFNLIALMMEHNWWSLAVAGGLLLWMASQIPNVVRIGHWVEAKQMEAR